MVNNMNFKVNYNINQLNRRIILQQLTYDNENSCKIWTTVEILWAKIELIHNTITTNHETIENKNQLLITIRKNSEVNKNMRIVYNEIVLYIKHIDDFDKKYTKIYCEETI